MVKKSIERHKYECGVRQLLKWRKDWGLAKFREYCNSREFYAKWITYSDDFVLQWRLGNRGDKDHWIG